MRIKDLIGKWEGADERNENGGLEFVDSTTVIIKLMGQVLPSSSYKIDASKDPMWLDLTISQGGQKMLLKSLIKLLDNSTLKWQVFPDGYRKDTFDPKAPETIILLVRKNN